MSGNEQMQSWKLFCGKMNCDVKFILEKMDATCSGLKSRETIQLIISAQFKILHVWLYQSLCVPMKPLSDIHFAHVVSLGTISALSYLQYRFLGKHVLPFSYLFFRSHKVSRTLSHKQNLKYDFRSSQNTRDLCLSYSIHFYMHFLEYIDLQTKATMGSPDLQTFAVTKTIDWAPLLTGNMIICMKHRKHLSSCAVVVAPERVSGVRWCQIKQHLQTWLTVLNLVQ